MNNAIKEASKSIDNFKTQIQIIFETDPKKPVSKNDLSEFSRQISYVFDDIQKALESIE